MEGKKYASEEEHIQTEIEKLDRLKMGEIINKGLSGDTIALGIALDKILDTKSKKIIKALLVPKAKNWEIINKFELYLTFNEGVQFINILLSEGMQVAEMYLTDCFIKKYKKEKYSVADTKNIIQMFTKDIEEILNA